MVGSITEITLPDRQNYKISDEDLEQVKVPEEFRSYVERLLRRNRELFVNEDRNLGRTNPVKIDTGIHEPIKKHLYRTGIVEWFNRPWGFPIVLVEKKDGTKRFNVDFRAHHKITKKYFSSYCPQTGITRVSKVFFQVIFKIRLLPSKTI